MEWIGELQTKGLEGKLHTNLEEGINDNPEEIQKRKDAYGSNTYPKKKPKGIWVRILGSCCCWRNRRNLCRIDLFWLITFRLIIHVYSDVVCAVNVDGLQHFVWEAAQDTTLIILMIAAVVSLAAEMWSEVFLLNVHSCIY